MFKKCASFALLVVAASAHAVNAKGTINSNVAASNLLFIGNDLVDGPVRIASSRFWSVPVGSVNYSFQPIDQWDGAYTFVGQYDTAGVTIALRNDVASAAISGNKTWDQVLSGLTETQAYNELSAIRAGQDNGLFYDFFNTNAALFPTFGQSSTLVKFSFATLGGTVTSRPVPEPGMLAALSLGALGAIRLRRRRSSRRDFAS